MAEELKKVLTEKKVSDSKVSKDAITKKDIKTDTKQAVKTDAKTEGKVAKEKIAKPKKEKVPAMTPEQMMVEAKKTTLADLKTLQLGDVVKSYNPDNERFQKAIFAGWDSKTNSAFFELCHDVWQLDSALLKDRPTMILKGKKDIIEWNSEKIKKVLSKFPAAVEIDFIKKTFAKEITAISHPAKA